MSEFYYEKLGIIKDDLYQLACKLLPKGYTVDLAINTADRSEKNDYYLLLTGSCIEAGEEGVVGRGNHSLGTIACTRSHSMEAPAGKNPAYFVGKVHTVIADSLSRTVAEIFDCYCEVSITTRNKDPLFEPLCVIVNTSRKVDKSLVNKIIDQHLQSRVWTPKIISGEILVPKPGKGNSYRMPGRER